MKQRGLFLRCGKNSTLSKTQGWEEVGGDGRRWEEVGGDGRRWEEVGGGGRWGEKMGGGGRWEDCVEPV